eukprot:6329243-Prymnesium_polylepis.2
MRPDPPTADMYVQTGVSRLPSSPIFRPSRPKLPTTVKLHHSQQLATLLGPSPLRQQWEQLVVGVVLVSDSFAEPSVSTPWSIQGAAEASPQSSTVSRLRGPAGLRRSHQARACRFHAIGTCFIGRRVIPPTGAARRGHTLEAQAAGGHERAHRREAKTSPDREGTASTSTDNGCAITWATTLGGATHTGRAHMGRETDKTDKIIPDHGTWRGAIVHA